MKWFKRIVLFAGLLVIVMMLGALYLARDTPDWYERPVLTVAQRQAAAQRAQDELLSAQSRFVTDAADRSAGRTPATGPAEVRTISVGDEELNSLFDAWADNRNWREPIGKFVHDPVLLFRKDRIILAGVVKEMGNAVASLHFEPRLTPDGQLDLNLVSVRGGNLPMPEAVYAKHRDRLVASLVRCLPEWQREAKLRPNGLTNNAAIAAGLGKMLVGGLTHRPSDAVLFVPTANNQGGVPVKLTDVTVEDGRLSLTVTPLDPGERQALIDRLREPFDRTTAMTQ
ncbi:MAG TPA: hypothetical protein VK324_07665 [Tepidisphaeraceae bacterium]|nr:hypothetical protein [Tepidisphaeraceae bacterium]